MGLRNENVLQALALLAMNAPIDLGTQGGTRIVLSNTSAAILASVNALLSSGGASAATAQKITGAAFNGTLGLGVMSPPRQVEMVFSNHANWDATTAVVIGTDANGNAQTDTIAIPDSGNATVATTKYFQTVTEIDIPAQSGAGGTFTVGYNANIAPGYYIALLTSTAGVCWVCAGATAVVPATGVMAAVGTAPVQSGAVIKHPGGAFSAILDDAAGTGYLALVPAF